MHHPLSEILSSTQSSGSPWRSTGGVCPRPHDPQYPSVDQELESATLTVDFQTPEMVAPQVTPVGLAQAAPVLVTAMTPERPAIFRYDFTPGFAGQAGSSPTRFKPSALGSYTLIVEATDKANHTTTRRLQLRTVNPGEQPASLDGPPRVDEILPGDGAKEVMVTTPIIVTFSEAVENVSSATLQLSEVASGTLVPTLVYTSVEGGRMRATLVPRSNLAFATGYRVTLAAGITDAVANPSYNNAKLPLQLPVTADFTTKAPRAFDLAAGDQFAGGRDIDLYTTEDGQKTYAYVTAGYLGRYTLDITDPTHPALVHSDPSPTSSRSMRGVSVEQSSGVLGVTENITYASGGQYGYLRLYDLAADPIAPPNIGREKLAEAYSGIPGRLDLAGNYAYIATTGAGLQVVDLDQVRSRGLGGAVADGSTIVGGFNSANQEYGEPNDAQVYGPGKLLVTTNSGYLLLLSVAVPSMPQLSSAYRPDGYQAVRAAAVSGYQYNAADGSPVVIDLAVTAGLGRLQTVDVSDPSNPQLLGSAVDEQGAPVVLYANDIAINPAAGLVFVTTFGSIQVFDIKDPLHPQRLANLAQLPDENGNLLPFGSVPALVEKGGWVYLASDKQGMRVLDLDPSILKIIDGTGNELGGGDEFKFGNGSNPAKVYHVEVVTESDNSMCHNSVDNQAGFSGELMIVGKFNQVVAEQKYTLIFKPNPQQNNRCLVDIVAANNTLKHNFVVNNSDETNTPTTIGSDTLKLAGGLGNKVKVRIMAYHEAVAKLKVFTAPIEPVGVIVLAIDGLRQDVLYRSMNQAAANAYDTPASYNDPDGCGANKNCYVPLSELPGLSKILRPESTVKMPGVTAIFPSITFASWASIFSGKPPKETGIVGNEFFARDRWAEGTTPIPGIEHLPKGLVSVDGGAFDPGEKLRLGGEQFAIQYVTPSEWFFGQGKDTLTEKLNVSAPMAAMLPSSPTLWKEVNDLVDWRYRVSRDPDLRCDKNGNECRTVSFFNQYPGTDRASVDWWGTPSRILKTIYDYATSGLDAAVVMDKGPVNEAEVFIKEYFKHGDNKRFPALFTIYLSGLDHNAHFAGMGDYQRFLKEVTDQEIGRLVKALRIRMSSTIKSSLSSLITGIQRCRRI